MTRGTEEGNDFFAQANGNMHGHRIGAHNQVARVHNAHELLDGIVAA